MVPGGWHALNPRRAWKGHPPRPSRTLGVPPLALEGADVHDRMAVAVAVARPPDTALVGERGEVVVTPVDGRAARQQRVGPGWAAVVGQRAELRVDGVDGRAHLVVVDVVDET